MQKGNIIIFLAALIAIASISVIFIAAQQIAKSLSGEQPPPFSMHCTQDAKLCPDGSYVSRSGPACEFAKCPGVTPAPVSLECKKDADCPSSQYVCEEVQGVGTACPSNDPSCVPTHTIVVGECKIKEGGQCKSNSSCASGFLCNNNACVNPIGRQCTGPADGSCPSDFECVQGCGSPVGYPGEPPPPYFCQLKGYVRTCPICLAQDTFIETPNGPIPVQDLKKGMAIWTVDELGNRISAPIVKTSKTPVSIDHTMVHIVLEDGREIFASPGHPTGDGRDFSEILVESLLEGKRVIIAEKVMYNKQHTYDILPAGSTGLYIANGILIGSTLH